MPQVILTGQLCLRLSGIVSQKRPERYRERATYEILNKNEKEERSGSQELAEGVVDSLSCRFLNSDGAELHK